METRKFQRHTSLQTQWLRHETTTACAGSFCLLFPLMEAKKGPEITPSSARQASEQTKTPEYS